MRTAFALGAVVASLAAGLAGPLSSSGSAATSCWRTVIGDWSVDGSIDGHYTTACLRQAMQNAPTDLKVYSTLEDVLQGALRERSSRRLAGAHVVPAVLDTSGGGSSVSLLVAVLAGAGGALAASSTGVVIVRRRRASR